MKVWIRCSHHQQSSRLSIVAAAFALTLSSGVSQIAQAAPFTAIGTAFKLNSSPPEPILFPDVEMNNVGAGIVLWQRYENGFYTTYFRRFDRYGNVSSLQTYDGPTATYKSFRVIKVFDNGEFAIESQQGTVLKIGIRSQNGGIARNLPNILCKTSTDCRAVMDDVGHVIVGDVVTISGRTHPVVQLHNAAGNVVKPWFAVDQAATGVTGTGRANVAIDADGDFVVAWKAFSGTGFEEHQSTFIRLYQKTGVAKAAQFRGHVTNKEPGLAMDADGDFIMTWEANWLNSDDINDPFWGSRNQGHTVYRKDGTKVLEGVHESVSWGADPEVIDRVVMDDGGDYVFLNAFSVSAQAFIGENLGAQLYRGFSSIRLGNIYFGQTIESPVIENLLYSPVLTGDIAMDAKGNLAVLRLQHGSFDTPPGLFLQRFAGPLGESCGGAGATIVGNDNGNTINGSAGDDVIHGKGGNDLIHGNGGNDVICGGTGADRLYGDAGMDRLFGHSEDDQLFGGDGNDTLEGGTGIDLADGGLGTDVCTAETKRNCP